MTETEKRDRNCSLPIPDEAVEAAWGKLPYSKRPEVERAIAAALPAILAQRDEEWRERLGAEIRRIEQQGDIPSRVFEAALSHLDKKGDS